MNYRAQVLAERDLIGFSDAEIDALKEELETAKQGLTE